MRDITEGMNESMKLTLEELATLKGSVDDYTQRTTTELEHLSTKVGMKPKIEVPKEVEDKVTSLERRISTKTKTMYLVLVCLAIHDFIIFDMVPTIQQDTHVIVVESTILNDRVVRYGKNSCTSSVFPLIFTSAVRESQSSNSAVICIDLHS